MKVTSKNIDKANLFIEASVPNNEVEQKIDELATKAGRQIKMDGFRQGKAPAAVVKKQHLEQLSQDAESEFVTKVLEQALAEAKIKKSDIIGEPIFEKYNKGDKSIDMEILVCLKPSVDVKGYKTKVPSFTKPKATEKEVDARINELAAQVAPLKSIEGNRALKKDDVAVFDFEGFLDGEPFEGGKAEAYELGIGSGQFIPGFEDQMEGMKKGEEKKIKIVFPKDYQAENLKGKETEFVVKLHDIKVKTKAKVDDKAAQAIIGKADATVDDLKEKTLEQLNTEKTSKMYNEDLKPKLLDALVNAYTFDLPKNIVEQEIDNLVNTKAQGMSKKEIEEIQKDAKKLDKLREESRKDATDSVSATFIVDAIAKAENIVVDDNEIYQVLYYEAAMNGQKGDELVEYYKKNNLIPALKMGMIEDKLFGKLLDLDSKQ